MEKTKNCWVIPTDKASRLLYNSTLKSFCIQKEIDGMFINDGKVSGANFWGLEKALNNGFQPHNIYITSNEEIKVGDWFYVKTPNIYGGNVAAKCLGFGENCWSEHILTDVADEKGYHPSHCSKVIATNNPNIDIPKVIDEVNIIIKNAFYDKKGDFKRSTIGADDWINGLKLGYNKAKETYQFTEEDIFGLKDLLQNTSPLMFEVVTRNYIRNLKETKTIYYE